MQRGRNKDLINSRDQRMFERYYYWTEVCRLRFDDALKKLSEEEFFISESRCMQIIRQKIQEGATCNGKQIEKPLFTGFKLKGRKTKAVSPSHARSSRELELFPG